MYNINILDPNSECFDIVASKIDSWSCGLWWPDFEEAGIEQCYILFDENDIPIGFQTLNMDGLTIAIEIHPDYRGMNLSYLLIEESGSIKPERDENPAFWEKVQERFD